MSSNGHKRVLVAPLDWGLGHTTRCIPLIIHLQSLGHQILFAGNHWQRQYINKALPAIETIDVAGYDMRYAATAAGFKWSLFTQLPRLMRCIRAEHQWLQHAVKHHKIDGIISDNRYGMFHTNIPSVFMTHQLQVQTGMGNAADNMLRKLHYKYINRFNECWVVDVPGVPNLSDALAHPSQLPKHTRYLGLLSQLDRTSPLSKETHLLVLLSGPEPQRSMLSDILWKQVADYKGRVVFVEGSVSAVKRSDVPAHISYHTQLNKEELQPTLQQASMVVCRSGYSTLMDLVTLNKRAIIIPTPGQTEQEYLGRSLHAGGVFYSKPQEGFNLQHALEETSDFPFKKLELGSEHKRYTDVLEDWVSRL